MRKSMTLILKAGNHSSIYGKSSMDTYYGAVGIALTHNSQVESGELCQMLFCRSISCLILRSNPLK
jgi:hypothetical protein